MSCPLKEGWLNERNIQSPALLKEDKDMDSRLQVDEEGCQRKLDGAAINHFIIQQSTVCSLKK